MDGDFQHGRADLKERLMQTAMGRRLLFKHRDEKFVKASLDDIGNTLEKGLHTASAPEKIQKRLAPGALSIEESKPENICVWARIARLSTENVELLVRHVALDYGIDGGALEEAQTKLHYLYKQSLSILHMIVESWNANNMSESIHFPADMTHKQVGGTGCYFYRIEDLFFILPLQPTFASFALRCGARSRHFRKNSTVQ